jgi:prevent-host-death family protein
MNVGVRELKQHLSEYIRRVGEGETLQVTDRGVPVALITPIVAPDPLARAVEEGWVRPPATGKAVGHHVRAKATRRVLDALHDDRDQ